MQNTCEKSFAKNFYKLEKSTTFEILAFEQNTLKLCGN